MKIFITGCQGFVGTVLQRHCREKGIETVGVDAVDGPGVRAIDIRSREIADAIPEGADALVHLAAVSRDPDCRKDPTGSFDINITGTLNLIEAARRRGVKQFVFASSEWVYGEAANHEVKTEDAPLDVNRIASPYALTKIVGERALYMAHADGFCPVTVLRFGIVYGPRPANWSAVEAVFNSVRTQDTVTVGSLRTARRFIHVEDIASGILACLGQSGYHIFNLSGDGLISLGDIVDTSSRLLGRSPRVIEKDPGGVVVRNPDNRRIKQTLGWTPSMDLEKGLRSLKDYFEQAGR